MASSRGGVNPKAVKEGLDRVVEELEVKPSEEFVQRLSMSLGSRIPGEASRHIQSPKAEAVVAEAQQHGIVAGELELIEKLTGYKRRELGGMGLPLKPDELRRRLIGHIRGVGHRVKPEQASDEEIPADEKVEPTEEVKPKSHPLVFEVNVGYGGTYPVQPLMRPAAETAKTTPPKPDRNTKEGGVSTASGFTQNAPSVPKPYETHFLFCQHAGTGLADEVDALFTQAEEAGRPYHLLIEERPPKRSYRIDPTVTQITQNHRGEVDRFKRVYEMGEQEAFDLYSYLERCVIESAYRTQYGIKVPENERILQDLRGFNLPPGEEQRFLVAIRRKAGERVARNEYTRENNYGAVRALNQAMTIVLTKHGIRREYAELTDSQKHLERMHDEGRELFRTKLLHDVALAFRKGVALKDLLPLISERNRRVRRFTDERDDLVVEKAPAVISKVKDELGLESVKTLVVYGGKHQPIVDKARKSPLWGEHGIQEQFAESEFSRNQITFLDDDHKVLLFAVTDQAVGSTIQGVDGRRRVFPGLKRKEVCGIIHDIDEAGYKVIEDAADVFDQHTTPLVGPIVRAAVVLGHIVGERRLRFDMPPREKQRIAEALKQCNLADKIRSDILEALTG